MKLTSRQRNLELQRPGEEISRHDVIVTLLADLQQEQDKESEILIRLLPDKVPMKILVKYFINCAPCECRHRVTPQTIIFIGMYNSLLPISSHLRTRQS